MSYEKLRELKLQVEVLPFGLSDESFTGKWYIELKQLMQDPEIHPVLLEAETQTGCTTAAAMGYLASCLTVGQNLACEPETREYFKQVLDITSKKIRTDSP